MSLRFVPIMIHYTVIILMLCMLPTNSAFSQITRNSSGSIQFDLSSGFIPKHKEEIAHLTTDYPTSISVSVDKKVFGEGAWERYYNYPDAGLAFIHFNYHNPMIGKSWAAIPYYRFYFGKNPMASGQFILQAGLGIGINTKKYTPETNEGNILVSTAINFGVMIKSGYEHKIGRKTFLTSQLSLIHFSNGSIKKPNSGINVLSAHLGIKYILLGHDITVDYSKPSTSVKKKWGYLVSLSSGKHEPKNIGDGSFPFVVLSAFIDRTINNKSKFGIGLEWFYSEALRRNLMDSQSLRSPDPSRIGLTASHELVFGCVSLVTQAGLYLYDPYALFDTVYLRVGLRKYFNHLFAGISVKSHAARAEAVEFTLGFRVR